MKKIVLTGAASAIAQATARLYATKRASFFLVDKDADRAQAVADDLKVRGASSVDYRALDLNDFASHQSLLEDAVRALGEIDVLLIAHGTLPKQREIETNWEKTHQELSTNLLSTLSLLTHFANYFEERKQGLIAVISSVAGDRGRQSNYIYGTAKGGITIFLQGLRNRLHKAGVVVVTIKPGFVDTPMTKDFKKGPLWVQPTVVARGIYNAIEKKKDVVYLPSFWRLIMLVIRLIPERIFKKLSL